MLMEPDIDPAREYDLYTERQERLYKEKTAGMTCGDCANCTEPGEGWKNPERMGWCEEVKDFVGLDEPVDPDECGDFE